MADALKAKPKSFKNAGKCGSLLLQCLKKHTKKQTLDSMPTHLPIYVSVRFYMRTLRKLPGVEAEIMKVLMSCLWSAWSMAALQQPHSIIHELKSIVSFKKIQSIFMVPKAFIFPHGCLFFPNWPLLIIGKITSSDRFCLKCKNFNNQPLIYASN